MDYPNWRSIIRAYNAFDLWIMYRYILKNIILIEIYNLFKIKEVVKKVQFIDEISFLVGNEI